MKSAVETLNPTRVKLSVEVTFDDLRPSLDAAYRRIAGQVNIPGFRRGKVPSAVIDQRVGRANVLNEALNEALPQMYDRALEENHLVALSSPELDVSDVGDGQAVSFTAEIDIKPNLQLPEFHGLQAVVDPISVSDDDVEREIEDMRKQAATFIPVEDRPAQMGDSVVLELSATTLDGETIEDARAADLRYEIGSGTMLEGLDDALVGLEPSKERVFESALVGGGHKGEEVRITVVIVEIDVVELPELDEEFVQTFSSYDTVDALRAGVREQLVRNARLEQGSQARDAVLARLLEVVDVPLPEGVVEQEKTNRRQSLARRLGASGLGMDDYLRSAGQTAEQYEEELDTQVRNAIRTFFVLEDIANVEDFEVSQKEVSFQLLAQAQANGLPQSQYERYIKSLSAEQIESAVADTRREKTLAHLVASAAVTDTDGNPVELERLLPDGTYAEAEETAVVSPEGEGEGAEAPVTDAAAAIPISGQFVSLDEPRA